MQSPSWSLLAGLTSAFLSLALARPAFSQKLHVMSYNIKGLPGLILSSDYKSERYELIGRQLARSQAEGKGPDLVLLQEAFSSNTEKLIRTSGYPHIVQGPPANTLFGLNSGLYILSRYPILAKAHQGFPQNACSSWDCFANKGMQYVQVQIPGVSRPLDLFNTHLQAGRNDPPARARQVKMLLEFFKKHHVPGNPVIFGGDFNIRPLINQSSYQDLVNGTGLANSGRFCLDQGCVRSPDSGWQGVWENAVDHQFYSSSEEIEIRPLSIERTYRERIDGFRLSDHLAHEVVFELRPGKSL